jgi:hypothetical protein
LVAHVDLSKISVSGHSRGGEASVGAYMRNMGVFNIGSVSSIAPVDGVGHVLPNVSYFVILPAADGDVADLGGLAYAPGKWTLKEVVGHLIDDERIFAYRAPCVARDDKRPLPGFEENAYVAATRLESRTLASLINEYRTVRAATITLFDSLSEEEWRRKGIVNGYEASLRGLAFHIAGHELHHLRTLKDKYLGRE